MQDEELKNLAEKALEARKFAYAPYSSFFVGAALLASDGKIFTGCNVENSAFSPGNCAERTAVFKAVSEGYRNFKAIAIAGGKNETVTEFCPPCGVCRQVLAEFCSGEFKIVLAKSSGEYRIFTLAELLPESFSL
jgi:cytidine deaminase